MAAAGGGKCAVANTDPGGIDICWPRGAKIKLRASAPIG